MELTALNETAPAVEQYAPGTLVEIDAGGGQIVEAHVAPNGQVYYVIDYALPDNRAATCTRWHDEIVLHPIDAAVMAIADDTNHSPDVGQMVAPRVPLLDGFVPPAHDVATDALASALVTGGAPSIDDKFKAMLDKGAAIIASIDTIKPLDLVVLKSGGPQMIVESIDERDTRALMCWWMDHTANLHVARFARELVELVPSAADMRDRSPLNPRNVTTGDPA